MHGVRPVDRRTPRQWWARAGRVPCPDCCGRGTVGSADHVLRCPTCRGGRKVRLALASLAGPPFAYGSVNAVRAEH